LRSASDLELDFLLVSAEAGITGDSIGDIVRSFITTTPTYPIAERLLITAEVLPVRMDSTEDMDSTAHTGLLHMRQLEACIPAHSAASIMAASPGDTPLADVQASEDFIAGVSTAVVAFMEAVVTGSSR